MAKSQKIWGANALFSRAHYTLGMWHRYKGNFTFLLFLHFCYLKFPLIFTVLRVIYVHTNPCFMASIFQPTDPLWERGLLAWTRPLRKWPSPTTCWEVMWLCSYNSKEAVITVASFTLIKSKYCNSSNSWISFLLSYRFSSSEFDGIDATEENAEMKGPGENG